MKMSIARLFVSLDIRDLILSFARVDSRRIAQKCFLEIVLMQSSLFQTLTYFFSGGRAYYRGTDILEFLLDFVSSEP
jgi:hypothetical protein